jgi:hypothetical protein
MFVRKKPNASGIISIQVLDKSHGKSRLVKTIGSSADPGEVESLFAEGKKWINTHLGQQDIFEQGDQVQEEKQTVEYVFSHIENILINGTQLILEKVFKSVGFDKLGDEVLKHLVIARLSQPLSKSATVAYLKDYFGEDLHYQKIYRYMDKLYNTKQEEIQKISVDHTRIRRKDWFNVL